MDFPANDGLAVGHDLTDRRVIGGVVNAKIIESGGELVQTGNGIRHEVPPRFVAALGGCRNLEGGGRLLPDEMPGGIRVAVHQVKKRSCVRALFVFDENDMRSREPVKDVP